MDARRCTLFLLRRFARPALAAVIGAAIVFSTGAVRPVSVSATRSSAPGFRPESSSHAPSPGGCSDAVHGRIHPTAGGDHMHIMVRLVGPRGTLHVSALIDTGASETAFPADDLRRAGFTAAPDDARIQLFGVVSGASASAYGYVLPADSILVRAGTRWAPLIRRPLDILGVSRMETPPLLAPDILAGGARLMATGTRWTLWPPCE